MKIGIEIGMRVEDLRVKNGEYDWWKNELLIGGGVCLVRLGEIGRLIDVEDW